MELPVWPEGGPVRLRDDQLRQFALDFCNGWIFTSDECEPHVVEICFLPLGLGALQNCPTEWIQKVAFIYEHKRARTCAFGINGCPIFFSLCFMHVDDWAILKPTITAEFERRKDIPLVKP